MKNVLILAVTVLLLLNGARAFSGDLECYGYKSTTSYFACGTHGNCTWWAAYMRPDLASAGITGDARYWYDNAENLGFDVGSEPKTGAIAVFTDPSHVAYVMSVGGGGSFSVSEMDYYGTYGDGVQYATYSPNGGTYERNGNGSWILKGFIYRRDHGTNLYCDNISSIWGICWTPSSADVSCHGGSGWTLYDFEQSSVIRVSTAEYCLKPGGIGGGGPGYETIPTDTPDPGLPDFIVKKLELSNYNPKKTDEIKMRAQLKNIGDDDISGDDDIETRYYLSMGYKEDSHSDWIRVGRDNTKGRNLDPGETHTEEEGLKLWDYSVIEPGKTYNIVACVDRTKDKDNGDGDYPEIHKSNNCSTEAVFTVQLATLTAPTEKFIWSSAGTVSGYQCTQILEPSDPHTWNDNYFCSDNDYGIAWSYNGAIANKRCTLIRESADGSYWDDNYLCVLTTSDIYFSWSSAGPITGKACVKWSEPADPDTWDDNYLCYEIKTTTPPPPPPEYNLQISSIGFWVQDRPKLWPGESFNVSATAYNPGDNLPSSVSVGYYLDDTLITSHSISASSLTNGTYFSDSLNSITAPTEPGNHSAKVCIDYDNQIQETDEADNCQSISVEVEEHLSPSAIINLFN